MFNVRLYGKQLFTWLSLVVSFMASFVLSFFPLDVLDGIWDLNESVSGGFLTYSSFAPEFQCCYFCESSCLLYLSFSFDFCVSNIMHL